MKNTIALDTSKPIYLIGGGGHCKVLVDCLMLLGVQIGGYNDFHSIEWLESLSIERLSDEKMCELSQQKQQIALAFLGNSSLSLQKRLENFQKYKALGAVFPSITHPNAIVSKMATLGEGTQVLVSAIVNANAAVGDCVVINSGAIVEHDSIIKSGSHVAPGAIILGGGVIGECCYLGAASIIVQEKTVEDLSFIKSNNIYNKAY